MAAGATILCADDFAISGGVSEGILSLAEMGRLSATSVIATTAHWPHLARAVNSLRANLAIGVHLNLTLGRPLGRMKGLAPDRTFPNLQRLMQLVLTGNVNRVEIADEIERQLDCFETGTSFPPDFIDGHQHVHAFPIIRHIVVNIVQRRYPDHGILLRDPTDDLIPTIRRGVAVLKALCVAGLAYGFRQLATSNGFLLNSGFSGYSTFGAVPYEIEFQTFLRYRGPVHMIMCHPGFAKDDHTIEDAISHRRAEEYVVLSERLDIPQMIWRPNRQRNTVGCNWPRSQKNDPDMLGAQG
jgi:predicted glycoside hydrolase/deacetylase ChbG (UPF0249 family)